VRAVQVHDEPVDRAHAGQRVALNLAGIARRDVARGDVIAPPGALAPALVLDCALTLRGARHGMRAHVHHGTREAPARLADLGDGLWQARLERPLLARAGDRVVVRSIAPPDTLGGGVVLDAEARRHGRRPDAVARLARLRRGEPDPAPARRSVARPAASQAPVELSPSALALEQRLREAGHEPPAERELDPDDLHALRAAGRAVRVGRDRYAHPEAVRAVRNRVEALVARDGAVTLAGLRDELGTSRQFAQALLEHFDAERVTRRRPDDSRVLRRIAQSPGAR
jgi:selenocysteine-specific elongation factor